MKEGDMVTWTSQAAGSHTTKQGTIVEVVPPRHRVKSKMKSLGMPRNHESYVVRAQVTSAVKNRRWRLYWPLAWKLRPVEKVE